MSNRFITALAALAAEGLPFSLNPNQADRLEALARAGDVIAARVREHARNGWPLRVAEPRHDRGLPAIFRGTELRAMKADHAHMDVARFKEAFGLSRKYAIPLLEYLDREGVTRRVGDERIIQ
jgi:selenocysteine-specific elongation factor